jgi:Spy/CpxP family protein refolding chaperone
MKKYSSLFIIIILLSSVFTTKVFAQPLIFDKDFIFLPKFLIDKLNLTETQEEKFEELQYKHQKIMIELRAELQQKILELKKYKSEGNLKRSKFIDLTNNILEVRNKIALARANHLMDIYEILDETQRKILDDYKPSGKGRYKMKKYFRGWME